MNAPVIDLGAVRQKRAADQRPVERGRNIVMVQPGKGGFEIVLCTFSGYRYHLATCEHLSDARSLAHNEAFKTGRCRVQILGDRGRA